MNIVLATENLGKLKEIQAFFSGLPITLLPQSTFNVPPVDENGLSFVENALLKARHASKISNLPALADDSGLCVDILRGEPGIYSARYARDHASHEENITKLLSVLSSIKAHDRSARFYCAIVFVRHHLDPIPIICQATWEGQILDKALGTDGFGYDPIFWIPALQCTAAQLSPLQKNKISHRAKALIAFTQQFKFEFKQFILTP